MPSKYSEIFSRLFFPAFFSRPFFLPSSGTMPRTSIKKSIFALLEDTDKWRTVYPVQRIEVIKWIYRKYNSRNGSRRGGHIVYLCSQSAFSKNGPIRALLPVRNLSAWNVMNINRFIFYYFIFFLVFSFLFYLCNKDLDS